MVQMSFWNGDPEQAAYGGRGVEGGGGGGGQELVSIQQLFGHWCLHRADLKANIFMGQVLPEADAHHAGQG